MKEKCAFVKCVSLLLELVLVERYNYQSLRVKH